MEQWQINRAGIINFWYYDDEEFHFESGRLLLRGANGSGKSVTMQSLVPLLFDGNKSPERLDPFGSRARRMDSYLLSDGLDLEERTGYLFLEFTKPESERFMTIGMGMRARKNMPMQTWYFIVWDNRRLGATYDLSLFKDVGVKLPLTQRELENRVGSGGQVFSKQGDYKRAVNDHLFGYTDLADFDELITLLIQIRSPKLSKEFKPTTMYEIMQNSLVTLTEEDLRPMSEAIENMDEIQETIETLKESMKAIGRVDAAFSKYNQFMLASKAKRYLDLLAESERLSSEAQRMKQKEIGLSKAREALGLKLKDLEEEQLQLRRKEERLGAHDLSKLALEKVELESVLVELKKNIATKENQVSEGVALQGQLDRKVRENLEDLAILLKDRKNLLFQMDGSAETSAFDEHVFFSGDFEKQASPPFDFSSHQRQLNRYKEQLRRGYQLLRESERLQRAYEELLEKRDAASHALEHQRQTVREHERQLAEIKEEFAEQTFAWGAGLKGLMIERKVLQQVVERVYRYGDPYRFDQVIAPVQEAYEEARQAVRSEISGLQGRAMNLEEELRHKREEWERLEAQVEPEPERAPAVLRNRQRLEEAGIAHVPLYRAIDFDRSVPEELRGPMEEALDDLGILDALVIAPDDRERALAMDRGMADKYLFSAPEILSQSLAQYMRPDTGESIVTPEQIDDAIRSILLNPDQGAVFIDETGGYGMGMVRGKSSGERPSRFIGYQSRKRYKAELLEAIERAMAELREQLSAIEDQIAEKKARLQSYREAWAAFPGQTDLDLAHGELGVQQQKQQHLNGVLEELNERCDGAYHALKAVQRETHEATHNILLAPKSNVYDEALEALGDYRADLQRLEGIDQKHLHLLEKGQSLEEQLQRLEDQLDDARYELNQMVARRVSTKQRRDHIDKELELKDYESVLVELENCRKRLDALPAQLKETIREQTATAEALKRLIEDLEDLAHREERIKDRLEIMGWTFEKELTLGYTLVPSITEIGEQSIEQSAEEVVRLHGEILESGKTLMDYRDTVNSRYLAEGGELLEYNLKGIVLFKETPFEALSDDDRMHIERLDIQARVQGRTVGFYEMKDLVERQIQDHGSLLEARDRQLFEETLINTVSRKISSKIYHSEKWVEKIDALMTSMNTSSGLKFNLRWKTKKAESEDQLSTQELVEILKGEPSLMTREKKDRLIAHFRSKINQMRERMKDAQEDRNFLTLMKEVLDYRKWFEFQLYFTKMGERKKELTNNAFYTFSGGEKAMAMYVPLFSAVYAKYQGGEADCPKVISLDEAFAGVDEKNIEDMFRLLVELDLSFIANSQVLFGDYETIPALGIYELIRPENVTYVTLIHYLWNGRERHLVNDGLDATRS